MKKILISIIIILLIGLGYTIGVKSLSIGQLKLESVGDIKNASANLDQKFNTSKEISAKTYPKSIEDLDKVVRDLKTAKQQYQAKTLNNPDVQSNLGIIQVEKYNIEYLWTIIGNYATKNGVTLTLDIKSTSAQDVYNLNFSLEGKYIGITDFIYSLEDDSELKFEIKDFKMNLDNLLKILKATPGVSFKPITEIVATLVSLATPLISVFSIFTVSFTIVPGFLSRLERTSSSTLYFLAISTERLLST